MDLHCCDLYNQLEVENEYYEYKRIVDHYFKDGILFLKARYVGGTLGEDNIVEFLFEDLNNYVLVEIERYIRYHVVEAFIRKGPFDYWVVKVFKGHTRYIRNFYRFKDIYRVCRL